MIGEKIFIDYYKFFYHKHHPVVQLVSVGMSVESSKRFISQLLLLDLQMDISRDAVTYPMFFELRRVVMQGERWDYMGVQIFNILHDCLDYIAYHAANYARNMAGAIHNISLEATRKQIELNMSYKNISEVACYSTVENIKKLQEITLDELVWGDIPNDILASEKKVEIITRLLTYDDGAIESLKLVVPLQLHTFFFFLERIIKKYSELTMDEEEKLMRKYTKLLVRLGIVKSHLEIFDPLVSLEGSTNLPSVLENIILDYTKLSCVNLADEDEIINRILTTRGNCFRLTS